MYECGSNLRHRLQHNSALWNRRMWNHQILRTQNKIANKKNIDIDDARPLRDFAQSAHCFFNELVSLQEMFRRKVCVDFQNAIEKPWLVQEIDRLRFING